jgi:hypothetical protein
MNDAIENNFHFKISRNCFDNVNIDGLDNIP